jgi:putative ABC transport system permease protein
MRLSLPLSRYDRGEVSAFYADLLERTRRIPGVTGATIAANGPPNAGLIFGVMEPEDRPFTERPKNNRIFVNYVRPDYFAVLGIRFIGGGAFRDTVTAAGEIVINQAAARVLWPDGAAVGRRFRTSAKGPWLRVTGVIADEVTAGFGRPAEPMLYIPEGQPVPARLIVRAAPGVDPTDHLRQVVISIDPLVSGASVSSLEADFARLTARQHFTMTVLMVFTGIAVLLSAIGLYGVMSYAVAQRTREIGVRVALGATRRQIASGVVSSGLRWTLLGIGFGTAGAWWATRFIESMLFGVARTDAISFGVGAVVLIGIALLACLVPARRAAGVDPIIAMRVE